MGNTLRKYKFNDIENLEDFTIIFFIRNIYDRIASIFNDKYNYIKNPDFVNNKFWKGVRHIYSPDSISKYELCKYVSEIYDLNIKINEFKLPNLVNRTLSSVYLTNNELNILPIKEQIKELKKFNN